MPATASLSGVACSIAGLLSLVSAFADPFDYFAVWLIVSNIPMLERFEQRSKGNVHADSSSPLANKSCRFLQLSLAVPILNPSATFGYHR